MTNELSDLADVFVKSSHPETIRQDLASGRLSFPLLAKPRSGFASRAIKVLLDESDLSKITDSHIIQELAMPRRSDPQFEAYHTQLQKRINHQVSEISIQLVYGKSQSLLGRMASINKLSNGVPIEILPFDEAMVWDAVDRLTPKLLEMGLRGPLNLQGRLTDNGLKIFEMNPRFTGITGLRALMGFNEVEACVKDWLELDASMSVMSVSANRFGVRQVQDKSVSISSDPRKSPAKTHLFITGASGYLGRNLIAKLASTEDYKITAFGRDLARLKTSVPGQSNLTYCDMRDVNNGNVSFGGIDVFLHLGSARPHHSAAELAESTRFSSKMLTMAAKNHVPVIINLSSQSVYGFKTPPMWTESTPVDPSILYAQAKYASEQHLASLAELFPHLKMVSIRMGSISGGVPGMLDVDVLSKMTMRALAGHPLLVTSATQMIQRIDIQDAVDGLITLMENIDKTRHSVYNMSSPELHSVLDIGRIVSESVASATSTNSVPLVFAEPQQSRSEVGMSSRLLEESIGWRAKISIRDSVESTVLRIVDSTPGDKILSVLV
jgi:nucleoside-diphosphate-sugar epimerase